MKYSKIALAVVCTFTTAICAAAPYIAPASKVNLFLTGKTNTIPDSDYLNPTSNIRLVKDSARSKIVDAFVTLNSTSMIYGISNAPKPLAATCSGNSSGCASISEKGVMPNTYGEYWPGQCVAFAKTMTKVVGTSKWYRNDALVTKIATGSISVGTMIAYFGDATGVIKDVYPSSSAKSHVAIYLATVRDLNNKVTGIWVADQNGTSTPYVIAKRIMPWDGTGRAGAKNYHVVGDAPLLVEDPL